MNEPLLSTLYLLACQFRAAIEKCAESRLPDGMRDFPSGACLDASLLLAKFLEQRGYGQFDRQLGYRGERSHVWLQRGNLVVDITPDQFSDMKSPVIVQRNSSWHAQFAGQPQCTADFELYENDPDVAAMLGGCYQYLLKQIPGV